MQLKLEDSGHVLKAVDAALENIRNYLEGGKPGRRQEQILRKHKRYEHRHLLVRFVRLKADGSAGGPEEENPVADVSAGGMRLELHKRVAMERECRISFAIFKPDGKKLLSGTAEVVHCSQQDEMQVVGLRFREVVQS